MNEEVKNQKLPKIFNPKFGDASERSIGQFPLQQRKHHRNIALETGRKTEQKESEDQDQQMKTVYPDSSRFDNIHKSGPNNPLSTLKAQKNEDDRKIKDALCEFPVELLEESLQSLQADMEREIERVKRKYQKKMSTIEKAIYFKLNGT